jgi:hypothetical protein
MAIQTSGLGTAAAVTTARMAVAQARLIGEAADEIGLSPRNSIREAATERALSHQATPRGLAKS